MDENQNQPVEEQTQDQDVRLNLDVPEGETNDVVENEKKNDEPATEVQPVTEHEKEVEERAADVAKGIDRSAYNCPDCAGGGLKTETEICQTCKGTGKV